jgi:hypothetical protein
MGSPVGEFVSAVSPSAPKESSWSSPFAIFGFAMIAASALAIAEVSYYSTTPALSAASLGTTLGIVVGVVAFVLFGIWGPSNE